MGASGAGAPNQPELPAAANLPLVHPIALRHYRSALDKGGRDTTKHQAACPGSALASSRLVLTPP